MIHVAYIKPVLVNGLGGVVDKNSSDTTLSAVMNAETQMRVIPSANAPNAHDTPTIETYLLREDADNMNIVHIDNTMIVSQSQNSPA